MAELDISANSIQLDCSVDSGICVEGATKDLKKKLQEFKRILFILERDKEAMRLLRERLSRIAERKIVKKKKDGQAVCNVCFTPIDTDDSKTCIACCSCAKNVCRDEKCSEWVPKEGEWRCQLCAARRDSYGKASTWVEEQYSVKGAMSLFSYPMRARSEIYIPLCDPNESAFLCNFESVSEAPSPINTNQKQHIREYIEEVLADMIGGSLDTTTVAPMATDENYQQVRNGHELQGVSNVRLRRLIESVIAETIRQPPFSSSGLTTTTAIDSSDVDHRDALPLNGNHCNGNGGQYFESKKYQDLLATAVLNKIVSTHGNGRHSESSPDLTSSSVLDNNHNALNVIKTDESVSSSSSVEPRSESSLTDPIRSINKDDELSPIGNYSTFYDDAANDNIEADRESVLSDFIASHMVPLPHISNDPASEEEEDDEDFISVASSRDAAWEDNWLFKKKKSSKTSSSVGMLVPAPKEDIRALIGDKPTDEVSDLSEAGSDTDDSLEMVSASLEGPLNDRLVNQHLIGGKNTKIVLDELVEQTSMISTSSLPENVPPYTETKNEFVVTNDGLNESEPLKISVNSCNKSIGNEAINSDVTKSVSTKAEKLVKETHQVIEDESIVPPPNDFTDDEKMRNLLAKFNEEQNNKTDSGDDNSSSLSPRSSISCALSDRISSESNCTDDSTTTVIDTFGSMGSGSNSDSGEEFSPDDSTDRESSATATTANNSTITTNNVTNQSHIYSPPPQPVLRTESACSKLLVSRTTGGNEEHVDDDPLKHLVPGSIAEREYKKWYNAVDMPNNPYSVEALKRRLSVGHDRVLDLPNISPCIEDNPLKLGENPGTEADDKSQERDYARYSRDYYINDAKHASGTTKKSPISPPQISSPTPTASSIELEERTESTVEPVEITPVKEMCHKLEKQCRIEADLYLATPVQVIEDIPQAFAEKNATQTVETIASLTTEAVSKLSSETSSLLTNESLTPSEDSDTIRIYDLKKQETRLIKEATHTTTITVPKSPEKKVRPTELNITPTLSPPIATVSSKSSTPTTFKFLQPKRKLIDPSQVLSIDLDTTPITPSTSEKPVIEADVVHAMPSVKALAKAFLMSSSTCSSSDNKWRKARAKSPLQLFKPTTPTPTPTPAANTSRIVQNQPELLIADTTSQGSEDATIASDLSSLETDPPSRIDADTMDTIALSRQSSQERALSPVLVSGCLRNNIAFFENLKNK